MANLDNIPQEVFDKIISYVKTEDFYVDWREQWETLRNLREANRALKKRAMPAVFECVTRWLSEQSVSNLTQISKSPHLAPYVRKMMIAPISFIVDKSKSESNFSLDDTTNVPYTEVEDLENTPSASQRYTSGQQTIVQQNGLERLSRCLNRTPNLQCIEFRLDSNYIGYKELRGDWNHPRMPKYSYAYSCEKVLPFVLEALSKTTLHIKELYIRPSREGWSDYYVLPGSVSKREVLSRDTIKTVFSEAAGEVVASLSTLEYLKIDPSSILRVHVDVPTFHAIRHLLESTPRLRSLTLKNIREVKNDEIAPFLSDLLPNIQYVQLAHLELADIRNTNNALITFIGKHGKTIQTVKLDGVSMSYGNLSERSAVESLRKNYEFNALKKFVIKQFMATRGHGVCWTTPDIAPYLLRVNDRCPL